MKSVIVYSGKGGVGKTTTTANVAKSLAGAGHKVFVLDADVNTPSMNIVFGSKGPSENIRVASMGFDADGMIYIEKSFVIKFIKSALREAKKFKADFLLIDTPPSVTDVHINLVKTLDVSGLVMVTQPNELSVSDVNRTAMFFKNRDVEVIGIVENMCTGSYDRDYSWEVLATIPFVESFKGEDVYEKYSSFYSAMVPKLENLDDIVIENQTRQIFDETITVDDLSQIPPGRLRFVNVSTWGYVRDELLYGDQGYSIHSFMPVDGHIEWATVERVERFVNAFKDSDQAYFTITKAPAVNVDILPGEIGQGTLYVDEKFYGLPRIKYNTFQGEVILFLYEVTPAEQRDIDDCLAHGGTVTSDGCYLPGRETLNEIYCVFGSAVGMSDLWEEKYDRIRNGKLREEVKSSVKIDKVA